MSLMSIQPPLSFFFFFKDPATTEIYTLSLHDALPISFGNVANGKRRAIAERLGMLERGEGIGRLAGLGDRDRKSTRLNSSHRCISYAVFCLKKKNRF